MRPGAVIVCWDGGRLVSAVVAAEEKGRLRLVLAGGAERRVQPARVAGVVEPTGPVPAATPEGRDEAGGRAAEAAARLDRMAGEVDVPLLRELASEEGDGPREAAWLAELAFGEAGGEPCAAVLLALSGDGVHFVRKADRWEPRAAETVAELIHQRQQMARREAEAEALWSALAAAVRGQGWTPSGSEPEQQALEALEELAVQEDKVRDAARKTALRALEASGLRYDRPWEGAFRLLRATGRFSSDDENLQPRRFDLRTVFPNEVLERARELAAAPPPRAARCDLTALEPISIDGTHTREIDDALSVESPHGEASGAMRLGIHIAEPACLVAPGDAVDVEAQARALTYYMPDLRLPMLPPALSEDAASLVAGAERPALSFLVELDGEGHVTGHEIVRSVVRTAERLDYDEADRRVRGGAGAHAETLGRLVELACRRAERRREAGAVMIVADEVDIHVDAGGRPVLDRLPADSPSRRLVSEAMVLAGEIAARTAGEADLPLIHRRQAPADGSAGAATGEVTDPVVVRRTRMTLRRATTGLEPGRHASLGLDAYAQVTSPLRRFQDLANQRQLASWLAGEPPCYDREALQRVLAGTERAESEARRAERAAKRYWMLRWLGARAGETFEAIVLEVDPRPVVLLESLAWEQPMPSLAGVEPGERIAVEVRRANPRAGLLVLARA